MPYIETKTYYENTTMREIRNNDGVLTGYDIAPIDGYVLHNISFDLYKYDFKTNEEKLINHGYSPSSCSVEPEYDFEANLYEIYAVKKDEVDSDYVY